LPCHVVERGDARIGPSEADGVVGERPVEVRLDEHRFDRLGVFHENGGIGRGAEPRHVERAADQALDDAVVVGRGEEPGRHAEELLGIGAEALVRGEPVLRVLAAEKADAELGDLLGVKWRGERRGGERGGNQSLHRRPLSFGDISPETVSG
jgi:hypothetical protein